MSEPPERRELLIRADLLDSVDARLKYTNFESKEKYVEYILNEVLFELSQKEEKIDIEGVEEQEVKNRLKSLGYLNE